MKECNFFEKWAAVPWLNSDTGQTLAPIMPTGNYDEVLKKIKEEQDKRKKSKLFKVLLGVGLAGGGLALGSNMMDASRARQAAQARKIVGGRVAKGVGSLGLLAAAIFGGKALLKGKGESDSSTTSTTPRRPFRGVGLDRVGDFLERMKSPEHQRNIQTGMRVRDLPLRNRNEQSPMSEALEFLAYATGSPQIGPLVRNLSLAADNALSDPRRSYNNERSQPAADRPSGGGRRSNNRLARAINGLLSQPGVARERMSENPHIVVQNRLNRLAQQNY